MSPEQVEASIGSPNEIQSQNNGNATFLVYIYNADRYGMYSAMDKSGKCYFKKNIFGNYKLKKWHSPRKFSSSFQRHQQKEQGSWSDRVPYFQFKTTQRIIFQRSKAFELTII